MIEILNPNTTVNLEYLKKELPDTTIVVENEKRAIERPTAVIDTSWIERAREMRSKMRITKRIGKRIIRRVKTDKGIIVRTYAAGRLISERYETKS